MKKGIIMDYSNSYGTINTQKVKDLNGQNMYGGHMTKLLNKDWYQK